MKNVFASIVVCSIFSTGMVHAELFIVDFEDYSVSPGTANLIGGFSTSTNNGIGVTVNSTFASHSIQNAIHGADNGSTYLATSGQGGTNVLRFVDDANLTYIDPFTLVSVDLAENRESFQTADRVTITGYLEGGGTKVKEVTLDGIYDGPNGQEDFQTVSFLDWNDMIYIEAQGFRGTLSVQGWYAIDNLVARSQPILDSPGDYDLDRDVDGNDLLLWQRRGSPGGGTQAELALWKANYGTVVLISATSAAVPETTTLPLALVALFLVVSNRRFYPATACTTN